MLAGPSRLPAPRAPLSRWLLAVLIFAAARSFAASEFPKPFTAEYSVRAGGVAVGTMTRRFSIDPAGRYQFVTRIKSTGIVAFFKPATIEETSIGSWTSELPRVEHYSYTREVGGKRKEATLEINWKNGSAIATANNASLRFTVGEGVLDKLNYQLVLMRDLVAQRATLDYVVADKGATTGYGLRRLASESISISGKEWQTVPVEYSRDDGRRTTWWCAPSLDYLPVRIEYREKDGAVTSADLRRLD